MYIALIAANDTTIVSSVRLALLLDSGQHLSLKCGVRLLRSRRSSRGCFAAPKRAPETLF